MVVRNQQRGEKARAEIVEKTGNKSIDVMLCDLSSMDSIVHFAESFRRKYNRLDVLLNNAGAVLNKREITAEGFERNLAVNYLGPFLLTNKLLDVLRVSAPSRIINVSSGLHGSDRVDLTDLQSERNYKGMRAYGNAKLMLIMFTYELAKRLEGTGVTVNVLMPGFVATNLGKNSGSLRSRLLFRMVRPMQASAKKGAETSIYLASSPDVANTTGRIFRKKLEVSSSPSSYDVKLREQFWNKAEEMLSKWL
jgi:NAD(P)-dependent dehydrogenase (short-subunit alcohol dehydrogenase family)